MAVLLSGCGALFYQPSHGMFTDPERRGYGWIPLAFERPGGGKLTAAMIPAKGPDSGRGLVIQFHGNGQNMSAHWLSLKWMVPWGYDLLVWDWSGYGESDGFPSREQTALDADAFLRFVSDSILPGRSGAVVLVGQSLGGAILPGAFVRWKDRDRATLLVDEGGFASYRAIARDRVGLNWFTWPAWPLVPLLIDEEDAPKHVLDRIAPTPLVVVSCLDDAVVPTRFQEAMHEAAPGSFWWPVEGCRHIGAFRADSLRFRLLGMLDSLRGAATP